MEQERAAPSDLTALARLLDTSFRVPGTRWRFGLDPLLGLVPGIGDAVGVVLSGYVVVRAARLGVGAPMLLRMLGNVAVEAVLGAVPLIGDLFDAAWKANTRNLALLNRHLADPAASRRGSRRWLAAVLIAAALGAAASLALGFWLFVRLLSALGI